MVRNAEGTARAAEATRFNRPGLCLQQCRLWADIPPKYPTATTAWNHANDRHHFGREIPRGAMAYWTGGSNGFGHIAVGMGGPGSPLRSTDAGGRGVVATHTLAWFDANWPSLNYAGWAWNVNEVNIPHEEEDEMQQEDWIRFNEIVEREVRQGINNAIPEIVNQVWAKELQVKKPDNSRALKPTGSMLRETWQRIART
jgi:hypothetical protein